MNEKLNKIEERIRSLDLDISAVQVRQFYDYYELLVKWNQFMNLTAITDFEDVVQKHFVDSLSITGEKKLQDVDNLIDVGTGAGFPGIPLKIMFPELKITLLDSLRKRVDFLNEVIDRLHLKQMETIHGRAEDIARQSDKRENFDLCVSRAVANLSVLSEYCIPFVKNNGYFISYKSEKVKEECDKAKTAINVLGGKYEKQIDFFLPESDIYRNLVVIKKIKSSPAKFPRKAGVPTKEPILT